MHKLPKIFRTYNIEKVQMIELLQSQIQTTSQNCDKESQLYNKKVAMLKKYQTVYLRYVEDQQSRLKEQFLMEDQEDQLHQQKMLFQQSLRQLKLKLKGTQLQKFDLLAKCQSHENKMQKLRAQYQKIKSNSKQILQQKSLLKMNIAENEAQIVKICSQSEILRKRCEQQLQQIGDRSVNNKHSSLIQKTKNILEQNIKNIQAIESSDKLQYEFHKQSQDTKNIESKQKVIELEIELKTQRCKNEYLRRQIQAQKNVETVLNMRQSFVQKINQFKQTILTNNQENQLKDQTLGLHQQNDLLKQKLAKFSVIKDEMLELYENLSLKLKSLKQQDARSLSKMHISSNRFEKELDYRKRHFLKERQSIVDRYSKYLQ